MRSLSSFLQSISKRRERERKQRAGIVGDIVYYHYNAPCNFPDLCKPRRKPFGKKRLRFDRILRETPFSIQGLLNGK
jgi:hypothetical protein